MRPWTILCDFDGTISACDVTDELLGRFARPEWQDLEESWRSGSIGSRECKVGQVALLDASATDIDRLLDDVCIDPAFPDFVEQAKSGGAELVVVSDGLDRAIRRILARHNLGHLPIIANHLVQTGARKWRMQSPHMQQACRSGSGTCKCASAGNHRGNQRNVLLVGDGRSDFCVAEQVDYVFAKSSLINHCRCLQLSHSPVRGFDDAIALLPELLHGRLGGSAGTTKISLPHWITAHD